jgi:hypothetical protein
VTARSYRSIALACTVWGLPCAAQATRCNVETSPRGSLTSYQAASGKEYNTWAGGGVTVRCPARKITITADSAEQWGDEGRVFLIGNVKYTEPQRLNLTSGFLTYWQRGDSLSATVDVVATLPSGSKLTGPVAKYFRAIPRVRPHDRMEATFAPVVTIAEKDSAGRPAPPLVVKAQTIIMDGDSVIFASRNVNIQRTDILAVGDSAYVDTKRERMSLFGSPAADPFIDAKREKPFKLTGRLIDSYSKNRKLERIISRGNATAVSQELTLAADTIDFRLSNDLLDHAIAWGSSRQARAVSPTQTIIADSLDVFMPGQRMRLVNALRNAFAESKPDSARFRTPDRDWLRGDTIVAHFDSLAPGDTTKNPPVRLIITTSGKKDAKAYYHLAPADTMSRDPAIAYVIGRSITLRFEKGRASIVTVRDSVAGIYAEPLPDSLKRKAALDSARRRAGPDSTGGGVRAGRVPGGPRRDAPQKAATPFAPGRETVAGETIGSGRQRPFVS